MNNTVLVGDCLERMAEIPAGWAHCCVTSPPYFALRSYLAKDHPDKDSEIGSEPTPEAFVATLVEVFRGVRRVLRDDGVLWVNLGDSYSQGCKGASQGVDPKQGARRFGVRATENGSCGIDAGNQLLMPHRVALALQDDGWCLRSTIIWEKKSPMPESVSGWRWRKCQRKVEGCSGGGGTRVQSGWTKETHPAEREPAKYVPCPGCRKCKDNGGLVLRRGKWRPTNSFEYLFMFTKGDDYFCDGDAVAEKAAFAESGRTSKKRGEFAGKGTDESQVGHEPFRAITETRNPRAVWQFPNEPFKGKHFATFPSSLPKRCIEASTSGPVCCAKCGACFAPVVESVRKPTRPGLTNQLDLTGLANRDPERHVTANVVTGHLPTCKCNAGTARCRVFDPFMGSGQTARAAFWLGCDWLGCELNPEYAAMIPARIAKKPKWAKNGVSAANLDTVSNSALPLLEVAA